MNAYLARMQGPVDVSMARVHRDVNLLAPDGHWNYSGAHIPWGWVLEPGPWSTALHARFQCCLLYSRNFET